uniref:2-C-methyl-D-erythritol 4-phosphate cytidylyltransferase n=1 Tax=Glaesserella sp. TaxID=2094731 RepID=UPI0035A02107
MTRNIIAVIPASGIGSRMNTPLPKQYLKIHGKTILEYTLQPFLNHPAINKIIVAVSKEDRYYSELTILQSAKIELVFGGKTRADSVFNALQQIDDDQAWVLVHDAARPC